MLPMNLKYPTIYFNIDNPESTPSISLCTPRNHHGCRSTPSNGDKVWSYWGEAFASTTGALNIGMIATACLTTHIFRHSSKRGLRTGLLKVIPDGLPDKEVNQCPVPYPHPAVPFGPGDRFSQLPPGPWLVEFQTSPWE